MVTNTFLIGSMQCRVNDVHYTNTQKALWILMITDSGADTNLYKGHLLSKCHCFKTLNVNMENTHLPVASDNDIPTWQ